MTAFRRRLLPDLFAIAARTIFFPNEKNRRSRYFSASVLTARAGLIGIGERRRWICNDGADPVQP